MWVCYGSVLPENWPPLPISQQPDMPSSGGGGRKHVEIVGLLSATFNPPEFGSDPSHTSHGGPCHGSLCGIMCKSVRWTNPRPARHLMRKSGIPNWPKSQPIPEPSWPEYPTNVDRLVKRSMCASAVTTKGCLEQFWKSLNNLQDSKILVEIEGRWQSMLIIKLSATWVALCASCFEKHYHLRWNH